MADELTSDERARLSRQRERITEIKTLIDMELRTSRPDRYEPGASWLDGVADRIAEHVPSLLARELLARDLVGQVEGASTKRGNKFLKTVLGVDGQPSLPVDWYLYSDYPVSINVPTVEDGEVVGYRKERVAMRAMTSGDWHNFSAFGRVDAQHRFDAEMTMYDAADWIAEQQGLRSFADWARLVAPGATQLTA